MRLVSTSSQNKNEYRNYPLKQGASFISTDGYRVPQDFIVGCNITTILENSRIFIKQIAFIEGVFLITIARMGGQSESKILGVFKGEVKQKYTTLQLERFSKYLSGNITIGSFESMQKISRVLLFDPSASELEESTIFCYIPPEVKSIRDDGNRETSGFVKFGRLINISKTLDTASKQIKFTSLSPLTLLNKADKSTILENCPNPVIKTINGVYPSSETGNSGNDKNIYIAGIKPVVFYGVMNPISQSLENGVLGIRTQNTTLTSLCTQKQKLLPPTAIDSFTIDSDNFKDVYYNKPAIGAREAGEDNLPFSRPARLAANFNSSKIPEYYFWPQFTKQDHYSNQKYWPTQQE